MNRADIATPGLAPLQLVGNAFWKDEAEFLILPETSWSQLHVNNNFKYFNISGFSNNGMVSISSNINNTVNKNVQVSIYTDSYLLEVIDVSHNLVISDNSSNTTSNLLSFCNGVFFSNAIVKNTPDKTNVVITGEEVIQANNRYIWRVKKKWRRQLHLFQGDSKLWRCSGRIGNTDVPCQVKRHYILRKIHHFTKLIIAYHHKLVKHNIMVYDNLDFSSARVLDSTG